MLASILLLCSGGCVAVKTPESKKIWAQQYDFNPQSTVRESLPSSNDTMLWAQYGPAETEAVIRDWLQANGVTFPPESFISIDWGSARSLRIGAPYSKYSIVVVNTEENLRLIDKLICEQMKGHMTNARVHLGDDHDPEIFGTLPKGEKTQR